MDTYRAVIEDLKRNFGRVLIFGSRARGDALKTSDLDIVVVDPSFRGMKYWERIRAVRKTIYHILERHPIDVDIIALTPEEFEELQKSRTNIIGYTTERGELVET
ncbi:MAG: uncharacterized protein PWP76_350 [Candidatus Diapherotrites archaeon]|nr:uncharacterized protein [Candidatus Diapherotrites archaeon]